MREAPEPLPRLGLAGRVARLAWLLLAAASFVCAGFADRWGLDRSRAVTAGLLLLAFAALATVAPYVRVIWADAYRAATEPPADPDPPEWPDADPSVRDWERNFDVVAAGPFTLRDLGAEASLLARADAVRREAEGPGWLLGDGRGPLAAERRQMAALAREMEALVAEGRAAAAGESSP